MSITMRDVARKSGVSVATVSFVVNGEPGISAATRDRVRQTIAALGYVPDDRARRLSTGRVGAVALVLTPYGGLDDLSFLSGLVEELRARDYVLVVEVADERFVAERLWEGLFSRRRIDALVTDGRIESPWLAELKASSHPFVLVGEGAGIAASREVAAQLWEQLRKRGT